MSAIVNNYKAKTYIIGLYNKNKCFLGVRFNDAFGKNEVAFIHESNLRPFNGFYFTFTSLRAAAKFHDRVKKHIIEEKFRKAKIYVYGIHNTRSGYRYFPDVIDGHTKRISRREISTWQP